MSTMTKTSTLRHSIVVSKGNQITNIRITLDDDCNNGHEDFSITANIREKDSRGRMVDAGGGCCHEHILSLRPELKPFVDLHLCTWQGVPMHCAANAFYWLAGHLGLSYVEHHGGSGSSAKSKEECLRIFKDHVRCTDSEQYRTHTCLDCQHKWTSKVVLSAHSPAISGERTEQCPSCNSRSISSSPWHTELSTLLECRSQEELQIAIEDLGIVKRWKKEAKAAIKQLEEWTGRKFESSATRGLWEPVKKEVRDLVNERKASGYYTPEAIAARDAEKAAAKKAKKRAQLIADYDKSVRKLEKELEVKLFILDNFDSKINCIYYDHTNEVAVNWSTCDKLITKDEFDAMAKVFEGFRTGLLPEGVQLRWQERPKY